MAPPPFSESIPLHVPRMVSSPLLLHHGNGETLDSDSILRALVKPEESVTDPIPIQNERYEALGLQPISPSEQESIADATFFKEPDRIDGVSNGTEIVDAVVSPSKPKEKRTVHWLDDYGKSIAEVREFEPSDSGDSDDDEDSDSPQSCNCVIQ